MTVLLRTTHTSPTRGDVALLRRSLAAAAAHVASEQDVLDVELVAGELIANAVIHAPGPVTVELVHEQAAALRLRVTDHAVDQLPRLRELAVLGESGRGLRVVAATCESWGCEVDPDSHTKTTWARLVLTS